MFPSSHSYCSSSQFPTSWWSIMRLMYPSEIKSQLSVKLGQRSGRWLLSLVCYPCCALPVFHNEPSSSNILKNSVLWPTSTPKEPIGTYSRDISSPHGHSLIFIVCSDGQKLATESDASAPVTQSIKVAEYSSITSNDNSDHDSLPLFNFVSISPSPSSCHCPRRSPTMMKQKLNCK